MRPGQTIRLFIALAAAVIILLTGCNPAKQVLKDQQAYRDLINDYNANTAPAVDTGVTVRKGIIDTFYFKPLLSPADNAAQQATKDSLINLLANSATENAVQMADCERQVKEAFDAGEKQALYLLSKQKQTKQRPDTIEKLLYPTLYIEGLKGKISSLEGQLQEAHKNKNWLWHFIISAAAAIVFLIILLYQIFNCKRK